MNRAFFLIGYRVADLPQPHLVWRPWWFEASSGVSREGKHALIICIPGRSSDCIGMVIYRWDFALVTDHYAYSPHATGMIWQKRQREVWVRVSCGRISARKHPTPYSISPCISWDMSEVDLIREVKTSLIGWLDTSALAKYDWTNPHL